MCKPLRRGAPDAYPGILIFPNGLETVESPLISRGYGDLFSSSYWIAVFPESLKNLGKYKDYELLNSLTSWRVYFQSNTPPKLDCLFMYWQNLDRVTKLEICVPEGAVDNYKEAWPEYERYIVEKSY